jgi:hypothetical protein
MNKYNLNHSDDLANNKVTLCLTPDVVLYASLVVKCVKDGFII